MAFRCGSVAIIGRPNVGKSTLLNAILGEKVSIVTPKPQTTRHQITGILNKPDAQIIFIDTPGYHHSTKPLNQMMNEMVSSAISDADIVCLMVEADAKEIERELFERIGPDRSIIVVNKADKIKRERYAEIASSYRDLGIKELVIISALKNEGVGELIDILRTRLPEGEALFPTDAYTTEKVRFMTAELIRQEVFLQMRQEIPYSAAVEIEKFKEPDEKNRVTIIEASIIVEKESQKGMVVGKGGARIKEIGVKARQAIEDLIQEKVYLTLNVKVVKNWTTREDKLKEFI